jgi:uncharacterized protein
LFGKSISDSPRAGNHNAGNRLREMQKNSTPPDLDAAEAARREERRRSRRRFLRAAGWTLGGLVGYGLLVEPNLPVVERVTVPLPNLPPAFDGFRIALLSDLHVQPLFPASRLAPAFDAARRERPDMILLLGDYTNDALPDSRVHIEACAAACRELKAPSGVYATFGNHDYPENPALQPDLAPWESAGIHTLNDAVAEVSHRGERIFLVGLMSALQRPTSPERYLPFLPKDATKIVLWHEPDRAEETARWGGSLQLSGHTHGGQVRIPGGGPILLPALGRRYPAGLYHAREMPLYVTRGVGVLFPYVRVACPPEVTVLTLKRRDG